MGSEKDLKALMADIKRRCDQTIEAAMKSCNSGAGSNVFDVFTRASQIMANAFGDCAILWDRAVSEIGRMKTLSVDAADRSKQVPDWLIDETISLLRAVERGGVPAFMTGNLRRLAVGWDVPLSDSKTPATIVTEIREAFSTSPM